ncbi:restriction endonuclease subunit S [Clostridium perfringens]|uniref:restriction endonuclease subunit S n=1 Tax=Clostridium perfringens TaxID=1502 RepID=UPI001E35EAA7|nr:restriction endonuclease subunit S [Clostridium perfringens]MCC5432229.1 restriction endonuclease subunit S [Clostridium perfringens]MCC5437361.1 restriction endonuclease subunit S [Clostridium perfringens]MCC5444980.1 restriction endonuclease subunit S [Clostridium perfringens]MCC5448880.1 restriction endonuclease subunit S [Clostridium perfringens]MDM0969957.1 restriction endonuclease subunit S [Clostridium perfringens]
MKLKDIFEKPISGEWGKEVGEGEKGSKVIRTTNFTNIGRLDLSSIVERDIDSIKHENKKLKFGDIIIEKSGGSPTQPVGRVVIFEETNEEVYFCNNFTSILRPNKNIVPKFGLYLLKNLYNKKKVLKFQNKTTGIINIKLNDYLNNTEITIPNLEVQNRIAEVLNKTQELIDKRKEQIESLDELVKSKFIEMFGNVITNSRNWETVKLKDICLLKSGGTPTRSKPEYFEGDIPWITTVALGKNLIDKNDAIEFITEEAIKNSATKLIQEDSLLFGMRVGVGKISVNTVPMCTNQDIMAITEIDISKYNLIFLKKIIESYSEYFNNQKRGATIQGIKSDTLKEIEIPIISQEIQHHFVDFVKQVDKLKFEMENSLKKLEDNFNSLMQKSFNGELFN